MILFEVPLLETAGGSQLKDTTSIADIAQQYTLAAQANLGMIDQLIVPRFAAANGLAEAEAKLMLSTCDHYYERAAACLGQLETLTAGLPEGGSRQFALLGAGLAAFTCSRVVVAQDASYLAQYDNGTITGFSHDASLSRHLTAAKDRSAAVIAMAVGSDGETILPTLWHEAGTLDSEDGPGKRMRAMYDFWTATAYANLVRSLAGQAVPLGFIEDF